MAERVTPQVLFDSHLPQEAIISDSGKWRLSPIGLLEMITREGKPHVFDREAVTSKGEWLEFPADHLIANLLSAARDATVRHTSDSVNPKVNVRLKTYHAFIHNVRSHMDGVIPNIWQEPLIKLLTELGYSQMEILGAVQRCFPKLSEDDKNVFNRAAASVWKTTPEKIKK